MVVFLFFLSCPNQYRKWIANLCIFHLCLFCCLPKPSVTNKKKRYSWFRCRVVSSWLQELTNLWIAIVHMGLVAATPAAQLRSRITLCARQMYQDTWASNQGRSGTGSGNISKMSEPCILSRLQHDCTQFIWFRCSQVRDLYWLDIQRSTLGPRG